MNYECSTLSRIEISLSEQVHNALQESSHLTQYLYQQQLHYIEIDGHVILKGTVGTFHEKQVAQEVVRNIDGVIRIDNQLEVNRRKAG